jgi:hypothetical protein
VAIIVLTAMLTFVGFIGTGRIVEAFLPILQTPETSQASTPIAPAAAESASSPSALTTAKREKRAADIKLTVDMIFNFFVLIVFAASLLNLIYRWKERSTGHSQGVARLTQYVCWLDELALLGADKLDLEKIKAIRTQYQSIVEQLPPNQDEDYKKAIDALGPKEVGVQPETKVVTTHNLTRGESDKDGEIAFLKDMISHSLVLMPVIRAVWRVSPELWLGGGPIRTCVWSDFSWPSASKIDFDVLYFDSSDLAESKEKLLAQQIRSCLPAGYRVTVKNQARMHLVNGEPQRNSLSEAIENFPETATSVAVRLDDDGELSILAPHGVRDLFDKVVRPTPFHDKYPTAYNRRIAEKNWSANWPDVQVVPATGEATVSSQDPSAPNAA